MSQTTNNKLIIPEKLKKEGRGNYWVKQKYRGAEWEMAKLSYINGEATGMFIGALAIYPLEGNVAEIGEEIVCPYNQ